MLCCIGDLVDDVAVYLTSDIAEASDTDVTIRRRRGGSAANVAVSAVTSGASSRFIGRVGSDMTGKLLVAEMERDGVDARVQREGRTGSIVVLVDGAGERSMLRDRGAAGELGPVDASWLEGVSWLHVPAYSLVDRPTSDSTRDVIATLRGRGVPVSIDASSTTIINDYGVDRFLEMVASHKPAVLFCNTEETAVLFNDALPMVDGVGVVVSKQGPEAAVAVASDGGVYSVPAVELADAADTTGAGDAFAAGFVLATMRGAGIAESLAAGHRHAERLLLSRP